MRKGIAELLVVHAAEVAGAGADGAFFAIEDGAVAVGGGKILDLGATRDVARRWEAAETIDASGRLVTPGLVDPHTHAISAGDRAGEFEERLRGRPYLEIVAAGGGIMATARAVRAAGEDDLYAIARARLDRMLAHGATTVEIKSGYGLTTADESKILRVARRLAADPAPRVVPTFLGAHSVPTEFAGRRAEYVDLVAEEMIPAVAAEGLARFCDVFCEEGVFTPGESRRILDAGKRRGLGAKLHADEIHDTGGAALAAEVGAVSADHLIAVSPGGIEAMRRAGVVPVLLPATSLYLLGGRFAPARAMIDAGLPPALATDCNPGTSPVESMQAVIALAATALRMTAREALLGATFHAARAVGLGNVAGSLAAGRAADLVVWTCPSHRHLPFDLGRNRAEVVIAAGRVAAREGRVVR